jgi:hypothetical protein
VQRECEREERPNSDPSTAPMIPATHRSYGKDREPDSEWNGVSERAMASEPTDVTESERSADRVDVEQYRASRGDPVEPGALGWIDQRPER